MRTNVLRLLHDYTPQMMTSQADNVDDACLRWRECRGRAPGKFQRVNDYLITRYDRTINLLESFERLLDCPQPSPFVKDVVRHLEGLLETIDETLGPVEDR